MGPSSVTGAAEVAQALRDLGDTIAEPADALDQLAAIGEAAARRRAPRQTGRLAGTIRGERLSLAAVLTAGGGSVRYAGPINFGWRVRNITPARFMQEGERQMEAQAVQLLDDEINASIRDRGLG